MATLDTGVIVHCSMKFHRKYSYVSAAMPRLMISAFHRSSSPTTRWTRGLFSHSVTARLRRGRSGVTYKKSSV